MPDPEAYRDETTDCGQYFNHDPVVFPFPNTQAETAAAIVIAVTLQAKSANTPVCEKWLEEEYNQKLMELQKRNPTMKPFFKPDMKVLAPDH